MLTKTGERTIILVDGTPFKQATYEWDGSDGTGGVLRTGPISGSIVLEDGTAYDVTPDVIEHKPGHEGPICYHIAKIHEKTGRLNKLIHGEEYDGPCSVTVLGTEAEFSFSPHVAGCPIAAR